METGCVLSPEPPTGGPFSESLEPGSQQQKGSRRSSFPSASRRYREVGGSNNRNLFSCSSGDEVWHGPGWLWGVSAPCQAPGDL